ncbi:hypothetical protein Ancab_001301 [Ancistrocladus abbreviatus]
MGRGNSVTTSLAPGFRFHPTDEELVSYYLKRKVCGRPFRFDAISEIDIYKTEPRDLPGLSKLKSRDLEWYFFSVLDKKYGNGSRTNRATEEGYWKTTGKDRVVYHKSRAVGMKKTLVYHCGRAPRGERTNWVMHEYRLVDEELEKAGISQDAFVLCRIFQKSGSGPKNGEQYGAPFIEEEWEDGNVENVVPGVEFVADEVFVGDDPVVEQEDFDQTLDVEVPSIVAPPPSSFYYEDSHNYDVESRDLTGNDHKPFTGISENQHGLEVLDDSKFFNLPLEPEIDTAAVKNEYMVEQSSAVNHGSNNYMPPETSIDAASSVPFGNGEPCEDIVNNVPFNDGLFLEANDLSEPVESNPLDFDTLEQYLTIFDVEDDIEKYLNFDSPEPLAADVSMSDTAFSMKENLDGVDQLPSASQQLPEAYGDDGASSSKQVAEFSKSKPDIPCPVGKQVSRMLGNIHAPPAFACEFPTKDKTAQLNAHQHSSGSVHLTAGMIRISNTTLSGNGVQWSLDKNGNVNVSLSFDLPEGVVNPAGLLPGKMASTVSRGWFYFSFIWVIVLAVSVKIGAYICAK